MDAATRAAGVLAALRSAGAPSGAVACRTAGDGLAAASARGLVDASAVFETGSVTKTVTGLLLALAIEAGEVSGSDWLDRFLPAAGPAGTATLAELATHTSGLPLVPRATLLRSLAHPADPYRGASLPWLICDTRRVRRGTPGKAAYSNLGVALVGQALAAAGRPYRTGILPASGSWPRSAWPAAGTRRSPPWPPPAGPGTRKRSGRPAACGRRPAGDGR